LSALERPGTAEADDEQRPENGAGPIPSTKHATSVGRPLQTKRRRTPSDAGDQWIENRAPTGWLPRLELRELWRFRELALTLALRDIKVRYKQTLLGVAWVVIQPLAAAAIFTVIFGRLAGLESDGLPYAVFVYSGVILWGYFSGALNMVAQSLVQNRDLVVKTYFPAMLVPIALALPGLVDLLVSLAIVGFVMALYGVTPSLALVLLPLWIAACVVVVMAAGLWLSALNVRYRDVRHTMTFLLQVWLFASPVVYASSLVEGGWQYVYALNPMVTVLDGFRWSLVDGPPPGVGEALASTAAVVTVLGSGLVYFLRAERRFADLI
jgi:homopolymeric O-antigen transport system permease protein